jgi:hypothetical protein
MSKRSWRSEASSNADESAASSPQSSVARRLSFGVEQDAADVSNAPRDPFTDVDPEDAQALYHPECCVFVAK